MKFNNTETLEEWALRVEAYERGRALMRIAEGNDPTIVLEEMATRVINKLTHSIVERLHNIPSTYDSKEAQESYRKLYLEKHKK